MAEPIHIASVAVFSPDGKLLFGRRNDDQKFTLPGGHAEEGETPEHAAVRELIEETGLRPESLEHIGDGPVVGRDGRELLIHCFVATVNGTPSNEQDPDHEVSEWRWVDVSDGLPEEIAGNLSARKNVTLQLLGLQSEEAGDDLSKMAIGDIPKGRFTGQQYDYSHVLNHDQRAQAYRVYVSGKAHLPHIAAYVHHGGRQVGYVEAELRGNTVHISDALIEHPDHRRKRLGVAMYEAVLAHAKHQYGATTVAGDEHSTSASQTHRALAQKHGLGYESEEVRALLDSDGDYDYSRGPYSYAIKSELEKATGKHIMPSGVQSRDGRALWEGNKRQPQFGKAESAPVQWAYHATSSDNLHSIAEYGLTAQPQQHQDEDRGIDPDEPALFFSHTPESASVWGEHILRFPWPENAQEDPYGDATGDIGAGYTNWYTSHGVPSEQIHVLQSDGAWKPIHEHVGVGLGNFGKAEEFSSDSPRGFVSPEGKFHAIPDHEDHHDWIGRAMGSTDPDDNDHHYQQAMDQGWVAVGIGRGHNVQGRSAILQNPNHPAVKTVRQLAATHWGPHFTVFDEKTRGGTEKRYDTKAFVGRGALTERSAFQKAISDAESVVIEALLAKTSGDDGTGLGHELEMDHYKPHNFKLPDSLLSHIRLEDHGTFGGYKVYGVNGEVIRDHVHIDFTDGGNPGRYRYVPEGELWVESGMSPTDAAAVVAHEAHECDLMQKEGMSYDKAHDSASRIEKIVRQKLGKSELHKADDEVTRLLNHPERTERKMALKLASVTPSHLARALVHPDVDTAREALYHPRLDGQTLLALFMGPHNEQLQLEALNHGHVDSRHLMALYRTSKDHPALDKADILTAIARHPALDEHSIRELFADNGPMPKVMLVEHPNMPADILNDVISKHLDGPEDKELARLANRALRHPRVEPKLLSRALIDGQLATRLAASTNATVPHEAIETALRQGVVPKLDDPDVHVRVNLLRGGNVTDKHLDVALDNFAPEVRQAALKSPQVRKRHIEKVLRGTNLQDVLVALQNPQVDEEHLKGLLDHQDTHMRVLGHLVASQRKAHDFQKSLDEFLGKAEPQTVWRVQNARGEGPDFTLGGQLEDMLPDQGEQPDPIEDFDEGVINKLPNQGMMPTRREVKEHTYLFGFPSQAHASQWYGSQGLTKLREHGFDLREVLAAEVFPSNSGKQVIFRPAKLGKSEDLRKMAVRPQDFQMIAGKLDQEGQKLVYHKPHLEAHPAEHSSVVEAYKQHILDDPKPIKIKGRKMGGSNYTSKVIYEIPKETVGGMGGAKFIVKPYHEDPGEPNMRRWSGTPHHGWAEMTNQGLYHAAGIGYLHQKVHVAEHNMGPGREKEPAIVIHVDPHVKSVWAAKVDARSRKPELRPTDKEIESTRKIALMDFLSGNMDRHANNLMVDHPNQRVLAIDHGRSFQYRSTFQHKWSERPPREMDDSLSNYIRHSGGIAQVDPLPRDRSNYDGRRRMTPQEVQDRIDKHRDEWQGVFDWWGQHSNSVAREMDKHLALIRDPEVRDHIKRNFDARRRMLDQMANFGLDNFGRDNWVDSGVPLYRPGQLTEDEQDDLAYKDTERKAI